METGKGNAQAGATVAVGPSSPTVAFDKKALAKAKQDFELHALLVQRQERLTRGQALYVVYLEGAPGLARRLSPSAASEGLRQSAGPGL